MFGNLAGAMGGYSGTAIRPPSTGIAAPNQAMGATNAAGALFGGAAGAMPQAQARPMPSMFGMNPSAQNQAPAPNAFGNMGAAMGTASPQSGMARSIGQIMSQLHPQAQQALRSIPPQMLQHLTQAGLVHPGLMQHFHGIQR